MLHLPRTATAYAYSSTMDNARAAAPLDELRVSLDLRTSHDGGCQARLFVLHECQICFTAVPVDEMKTLPHPFAPPDANLSGHWYEPWTCTLPRRSLVLRSSPCLGRMCSDCIQRHHGECPFCRSPPLAPPPKGFIGVWTAGDAANDGQYETDEQTPAPPRARRASAVSRLASRLLSRSPDVRARRRSRAPAVCRGCKHGCIQCDPSGDRMNFDEFDFCGLTGI